MNWLDGFAAIGFAAQDVIDDIKDGFAFLFGGLAARRKVAGFGFGILVLLEAKDLMAEARENVKEARE